MKKNNISINIYWSLIQCFFIIVFQYIIRKIIVLNIGISALGFVNFLNDLIAVLALSELGISNVITFKLYKLLNANNKEKINAYMNYIKKYYAFISIFILIVGVLLYPVLLMTINDFTFTLEYTFTYFVFIIYSAINYIFSYRYVIINADQKNYIYCKYYVLVSLFSYILIVALIIYSNSILLYITLLLITRLIINFFICKKVKKLYPYLNDKDGYLIPNEKKNIKKDVSNIFIAKMAGIVNDYSDTFVITFMLGLDKFALYSNYLLFSITYKNVIAKMAISIRGFLGKVFNTGTTSDKINSFRNLNFMAFLLGGFGSILICFLATPFIKIWFGNEYILNQSIVILIGISLYMAIYKLPLLNICTVSGMFKNDKYSGLIAVVSNLSASVFLVYNFGLIGAVIGTIISQIIVYIYKFATLYKAIFLANAKRDALYIFKYLFTIVINIFINYVIFSYLSLTNIYIDFIFKLFICLIIFFISILFYYKTDEFHYFKKAIKNKFHMQ